MRHEVRHRCVASAGMAQLSQVIGESDPPAPLGVPKLEAVALPADTNRVDVRAYAPRRQEVVVQRHHP